MCVHMIHTSMHYGGGGLTELLLTRHAAEVNVLCTGVCLSSEDGDFIMNAGIR